MIYLCSSSPRRIELLKLITNNFSILEPNFSEPTPFSTPREYTVYNALNKVTSVSNNSNDIFLSADTVVSFNNQIFGKPDTKEDAKRQLKILSGNSHKVTTGIAIIHKDKEITNFSETNVLFEELSDKEIDYYVETEEPLDKAGSYGIQGLGARFVKEISGCYFNVVGLPISLIYKELSKIVKEIY